MSQAYNSPPPPTSRVRAGLLIAWAALSASAAAFVFACGTNSPTVDEWEFVPVVTGHEPAGPWLFARHNEHRFPLPRAAYVAIVRAATDYRAASLFQVVCLSGLALGLMRTAARVRGRRAWADLFFPLSLLHLGHWENFLQGYQVVFVLYTVLAGAITVVAARATPANRFRMGLAAGVLGGLLALCGGSGVIVAGPVGLWVLSLAAAEAWAGRRVQAVLLLGAALLPLGYDGWYLATYERPPHHPLPSAAKEPATAVVMVTAEVLAMAFGPGSGPAWVGAFAVAFGLGVVVTLGLANELRSPADRPAAGGLLAVVLGVGAVALAVGIARAGFGTDMGLWARYALLTWPALGAAYLYGVRFGSRWVTGGLCVAAAALFPWNTAMGIGAGMTVRGVLAGVEADARAGVPPEQIVADRFPASMQDGQQERGVVGMPMLRDAGFGAYAGKGRWDGLGWVAVGAAGLAALAVAGRWLGHLGRTVQHERARELFRLQHERFEAALLEAAAATGKPRGLRWVGCTITGDAVLARDATTRGIVGLVPVDIRFEPEEGSDMEANPAAREPRPATAVFTFVAGHWQTDGRVVFNLSPYEAVAHFKDTLAILSD